MFYPLLKSGVLKCPTIMVLLCISPFNSVSICLTYLGTLMLAAQTFINCIQYLSTYLSFPMSFIFMLLCYCLVSFVSTSRTLFSISCKAGLVVTNFFSFCLSGKVIISPLSKNSFEECFILR